MIDSLCDASSPSADGTFVIREGWRQGRGAFGGLTIAAAIRAIEARVGDSRRTVRSVTAELPGPSLPGEARFVVDILRSGNSVTVARAALHQQDAVTTHAVAILGTTRSSDLSWRELAMPTATDWRSLDAPTMSGGFPEFAQHFEYRLLTGVPFTGGASAVTTGWIRARHPGDARDAAYIAAMMDAWWPALMVRLTAPRPLATIAYTLEILDGVDGLPADAPLLYRGSVPIAGDGYFLETRELWGEDGRLVALNHQTFAVIR